MREELKRESPLAVPFNQGFICPRCMGVCVGEKWKDTLRYCPRCGQRLMLLSPTEWQVLKKVVNKELTNKECELVELIRYENGPDIAGVYIDDFIDYLKKIGREDAYAGVCGGSHSFMSGTTSHHSSAE